jgi:hypothetical protein
MNKKLSNFSKGLYSRLLQFPSYSSINVFLHGKKDKKKWCYDKILVHLKEFAPWNI